MADACRYFHSVGNTTAVVFPESQVLQCRSEKTGFMLNRRGTVH